VITLRKLESLPPSTRGRKLLTLLADDHDPAYDSELVRLALGLLGEPVGTVPDGRAKAVLRQRLGLSLGLTTADWDLQAPADRQGEVVRFPFSVWLEDLRSPFNVGSVVRTAEAYGFSAVYHSPSTPGLDQPRARRTAMGAEAEVLVEALSLDQLRVRWGRRPVFALELGGTPVESFAFPAEGLVLVGGEELGLGPESLAWAEASVGRVSLPLYGRKASLNVGVAFGVLAAAWTSHRNLRGSVKTEG